MKSVKREIVKRWISVAVVAFFVMSSLYLLEAGGQNISQPTGELPLPETKQAATERDALKKEVTKLKNQVAELEKQRDRLISQSLQYNALSLDVIQLLRQSSQVYEHYRNRYDRIPSN